MCPRSEDCICRESPSYRRYPVRGTYPDGRGAFRQPQRARDCFVADFSARDGVLKPKTVALDAQHTTARVEGQIDLGSEKLDLRVIANPKDFSLLALRGPIIVSGTFADPSVRADLANAILRTGAAVALGVIAGPAAPLPFLQFGSGETFNCGKTVDAINRFVRAESNSTEEAG